MNHSKIAQAAENCLEYATKTDRPFFHAKSYIDKLKSDPRWSAEEVAEVQTEVIRALMQRLGSTSAALETPPPS